MLDYCLGLRITNRGSSITIYESEVSRTMKPLEPSSLRIHIAVSASTGQGSERS